MKRYFVITMIVMAALMVGMRCGDAQETSGASQKPVEISAAGTLEWHQQDKQYVAVGDVEATQGDVRILAERLVADYYDDENKTGSQSVKTQDASNTAGGVKIWQLTATPKEGEQVLLKNADSKAVGDRAVYNVETGLGVLTGRDLKLTTPDQVITARERMEYNTQKGIAKAVGSAQIVEQTNRLNAQTITAYFEKDKTGQQKLTRAVATGGVTITTPDEVLTGDKGTYNATNNTAEVTGNVVIKRGVNMLEGARAQVNLTTNVSKMFSGAAGSGKRVKGIFFPGSEKAPTSKESQP